MRRTTNNARIKFTDEEMQDMADRGYTPQQYWAYRTAKAEMADSHIQEERGEILRDSDIFSTPTAREEQKSASDLIAEAIVPYAPVIMQGIGAVVSGWMSKNLKPKEDPKIEQPQIDDQTAYELMHTNPHTGLVYTKYLLK
jgi:hypothetical protein